MSPEILIIDTYLINFNTFTITFNNKVFELIELADGSFGCIELRIIKDYSDTIREAYVNYLNYLKEANPQYFETKICKNLLLDTSLVISNPDLSNFKYPFEAQEITYKNLDPEDGHPLMTLDVSDKLIWLIHNGECYEESWILVFKSQNYYCCYEAHCSYSGFEAMGSAQLIYSTDPDKLWALGLTNSIRSEIVT
jgi:hypothetical protein